MLPDGPRICFSGWLAGVWIDRFPRRTVLIGGDLGRGLILAGVCVAAVTGLSRFRRLMILMFAFGTLALTSDAAYQSFLPQLVPRSLLTQANARLQQSDTVAQTTGSAVAGGLVALVTAPVALLVDAVSYFFSAAVLLTLERPSARRQFEANNDFTGKSPRVCGGSIATPIWRPWPGAPTSGLSAPPSSGQSCRR